MICNLCPRKCNAIRNEKEGKGFCGLSDNPKVARIAPHLWEEPPISGSKGSGAVFFSGCTLRCVFCQNYEISAENRGTIITPEKLADEFKELEEIGVHNINLVSPTPYVNLIKNALDIYKPSVPILYNSSGYERTSTIDSLKGYVDIYLPDFKYSDNELANNYSKAPNYTEITTNTIIEMTKQVGENEYDDNGIMKKGIIIRHLVLPNHTRNSISVLDIINDKFKNTPVSLMGQYVPVHKAFEYGKLNRRITTREYNKVKNHMIELGLNGFTQELSSADEAFIPDWDYK